MRNKKNIARHEPQGLTVVAGKSAFPLLPFVFCLGLSLAGCGVQPYIDEGSYLTYEHPFTDAATESIRQNAEKTCAARKRIAVRTERTCSLKTCTTSYQCADGLEREKLQQGK